MKKWHFKKWFQIIIEIITATSFCLLIGINDMDWSNIWSYIIIAILMANTFFGAKLLERYGR